VPPDGEILEGFELVVERAARDRLHGSIGRRSRQHARLEHGIVGRPRARQPANGEQHDEDCSQYRVHPCPPRTAASSVRGHGLFVLGMYLSSETGMAQFGEIMEIANSLPGHPASWPERACQPSSV